MGPGSDGPMGGMGGMEPHHMNGSLGERPRGGLRLGEPRRAFAPWAEHPRVGPQFGPVLEALEIGGGVRRGDAGQGGAGTIAARSIRLFSFCVPPAQGQET